MTNQKEEQPQSHSTSQTFPGFPPERGTWQFPMALDGYVQDLTGAEFKVLWYILRHTYGWQKTEDAISVTQFEEGISRKDGTSVDRGTGLDRRTIWKAVKTLKEKKFIEVVKREGQASSYRPKVSPDQVQNCHTCQVQSGHPTRDTECTWSPGTKRPPTIDNSTIDNTNSVRQGRTVPERNKLFTEILSLFESESGVKIDETNRGKNLKAVKTIVDAGYSFEDVKETMSVVKGLEYITKWDMLTVQKYIASVKASKERITGQKPLQIIGGKFYYAVKGIEEDERAGRIYWDGNQWVRVL